MRSQRIAVIGGVASGTAAAAEARRVDANAEIVLFERSEYISYGACEIPLFLAGTVKEAEQLIAFTPERFEKERGISVRTRVNVEQIDARSGRLDYTLLENGDRGSEHFDKFVLATGALARVPDFDGANADNVFAVRELSHAVALKDYIGKHHLHHAVVVGGGFVGIEVAEALAHRGIRVSLLQPKPGPLHAHLEDEMSRLAQKILENSGVTVRNDRLAGFELSQQGVVSAIRTHSRELIGCQLVILAMGIKPNTTIGVAAGIKTGASGGYRVDEGMRTNLTNVWACGDCIEVERIIDQKQVLSPLSLTAFKTGRTAGRNVARRGSGKPSRFRGVVGAQGLKLFDSEIAYVGLTSREASAAGFSARTVTIKHRTKAALVPGSEEIHITLVFETSRGRLLGGQLIGGAGTVLRGDILIPLIRAGASVADLYDQDLIYAPPFSPRLDPLLVAARQAVKALGNSQNS